MLKRVLCFLLVLMLPCAAMAEYVMAGYDDEKTYRDWSTNKFFQRMEEKTGVTFTYRQYIKKDEWSAAKANMQTGDADLPDVLFKAMLSEAECMEMLERGVLIDLAPYIAEHCPNLSALMIENPQIADAITLPDGRIAALPAVSEQPLQNCVWLNSEWLKELKLEVPTTTDELVQVLRAFRDKDPNKNGRKDEIPLSFLGAFDLKFLGHAFGLISNDYNIRAVDGKVEFVPLNENFRPFIEWLHLLYSEGLLDKEGFSTSDTMRQVTDEEKTNVYGGMITTMISNVLPATWMGKYQVMPPIAYNGAQIYRSFVGPVITGTFAVTSACDNVPEILKWVDSFYTEEVYILSSAGQENVDYVIDGDGTWRMTENATRNNYFTSESLISSGTSAPGLASDGFQRRYSDQTVAFVSDQMNIVNSLAQRPFPYYALTRSQAEEIAPQQAKIGRLVDEAISRWVNGEDEISDETFAAFEAELNEAGIDEFIAFWQKVLDGVNAQ